MAQLRRKEDEFRSIGARVVLVGLGTREETVAFKTKYDIPFEIIVDPGRHLFRAFQIKQASGRSLLSVGMALKGLSTMARGHGIGVPKGDVRQLPGAFIIDARGTIQFSHYAKDPSDHPSADDLLKHIPSVSAVG